MSAGSCESLRWLQEMTGKELEYVSLSRDTTESDLKQRREITSGTALHVDQVRAIIIILTHDFVVLLCTHTHMLFAYRHFLLAIFHLNVAFRQLSF